MELLGDLFLRSGRICKQPVIVKKVASNADSLKVRAKTGRTVEGTRKASRRAVSRPAPPPPDISGGIGIGGVF